MRSSRVAAAAAGESCRRFEHGVRRPTGTLMLSLHCLQVGMTSTALSSSAARVMASLSKGSRTPALVTTAVELCTG